MNFDVFMKQLKDWQEKPHMFIVDSKRMKQVENAHNILESIICKYSPDAKFEVEMNTLNTGSAALTVETDDVVVNNVQDFIAAIEHADNFEIYPLTDGNIRISVTFNGVMKVIK